MTGPKTMTRALSAADDGTEVTVPVGARLAIRLSEPAASGYRWAVVSGATGVLRLEDSAPIGSAAIGSAGEVVLTFHVQAAGDGVLVLACRRSWEADSAPLAEFTLRVRATAQR